MSLIKNIEIWNNQRPRVCNFDIEDYCYGGAIGNTCTGVTSAPDPEEFFISARATNDAWIKAVNEYFLASYAFYIDVAYFDPNTGAEIIPEGLINEKCNSLVNITEMCNLYYNQTDGFIVKHIAFKSKRAQLYNSLLPDGNPDKKTSVFTYTENVPVAPNTAYQPYTYSIDFTNYQTPSYDIYIEYRTVMGDMMQQLKKIITATSNSPLTHFEI